MQPTKHVYCSQNTRSESREQPIGSASGFTRAFLIETPLPWARKPLESPTIAPELLDALASYEEKIGKASVYLLVPDARYSVEGARLIDVQAVDGRIEKRDLIATDGNIAAIIQSIADDAPLPESSVIDLTPWRDLAVCTHGTRDACCASFGIPMYMKLHIAAEQLPHTRVWRCSHLGGHRFAPTMLDLPSGRSWGLLDDDAALGILRGNIEPRDVAGHYRGWVGFKHSEIQLLESAILQELGWIWTEYTKLADVVECDKEGRGVRVRISGTHPTLEEIHFEGEIEWGETFSTIASCNATPVEYVRKRLLQVRRLSPTT